jgi:hypothetical protein
MFGHHDEQSNNDEHNKAADNAAIDSLGDVSLGDNSAPSDQPQIAGSITPETINDVVSPAGGFPRSAGTQASSHNPADPPADTTEDELIDSSNNDLIDIKQHALTELAPLIDQLDQAPEERFRTIMMMIQASDDQALVKAAYEAAHNITDEKVKAQALLDIVNEINYFTQSPEA